MRVVLLWGAELLLAPTFLVCESHATLENPVVAEVLVSLQYMGPPVNDWLAASQLSIHNELLAKY